PDRDVRHEPAVHDVDVELVGAAGLDARDVGGERGEVGREDRRRDLDHEAVIPETSERRKRTAENPSVPWRWGRDRSQLSAPSGSGDATGAAGRNSGAAARDACAAAS